MNDSISTILFFVLIFTFGLILIIIGINALESLLEETKKNKCKILFFSQLQSMLQKKLIKNRDDINLLVNSVNQKFRTNFTLKHLLQNFLLENEAENNEDYELLKKYITAEMNDDLVTCDIPAEFLNSFFRIKRAVKDKNYPLIDEDLNYLANVTKSKFKKYKRANVVASISIVTGLIGILFTIYTFTGKPEEIDYSKIEKIILTNTPEKEWSHPLPANDRVISNQD